MTAILQTTFSNTFSFFMNDKYCILILLWLSFVPKGSINNISALVLVMAWRRTGDKPLPEQMVTHFTDSYMRHRRGGGGDDLSQSLHMGVRNDWNTQRHCGRMSKIIQMDWILLYLTMWNISYSNVPQIDLYKMSEQYIFCYNRRKTPVCVHD